MSRDTAGRMPPALWVTVPLAWSTVVYAPILANYFFADDFLNLYRIANLPALEYVLMPHGGHVLLVRNALFWLFRAVFGLRAELFFAAVLCTHLLNVGLLFAAARTLTGSALLACLAATLWGGAPLHQGTLGWYSVYGQVVTTTGLLIILLRVVRLRAAGRAPSRVELGCWYALALVAATSFGVGLGAAMVLPFALALLLPDWRRWSARPPLLSLLLAVPVIYVGVYVLFTLASGEPLSGWQELARALAGSSRAGAAPARLELAAAYLRGFPAALAMLADMLAYASTQLLLASTPVARLGERFWFSVLAGVAGAAVAAARVDASTRRPLIGLGLLAVGCYAAIALGRGAALSALGVAQAELADRYHYAATAPLALLLAVILYGVTRGFAVGGRAARALVMAWLGWVVVSYAIWAPRIEHHDVARSATARVLAEVPRVVAAAPPGEPVYLANRPFAPTATVISPLDFPGWGALYIAFERRDSAAREFRFVEPNAAVAQAARRGRRSATLLTTAAAVPADRTVAQPQPVDAGLTEVPFGFPP